VANDDGRLIAGKYRLKEVIGRGSIGVVWRARDESLDRDVAIKEVRLPQGVESDMVDSLHARTLREARSAARLSHPGIVVIHEVVRHDDQPWIVMELVRGRTLQQIIESDWPPSPERTAELGMKILAGLRAAHAAGVVHRDIKPSNVLIDDERAVITDFGIAALDGGTVLTRTGSLLGTPAYMSPEQARGETATAASDLWSLGATLYAVVEGRAPYAGESLAAVLVSVVSADPPPPVRAGPLTPVLAALLAKDPDLRASAEEAAERLALVAAGGSVGEAPRELTADRPVPSPVVYEPTRDWVRQDATVPAGARWPRRARPVALGALIGLAVPLIAAAVWLPGRSRTTPHHHAPTPSPTATPLPRKFPSTALKGDTNVFSVAFSPDGTRLAGGASDNTVRLWDVGSRTQAAQLVKHTDSVNLVAFSHDGRRLATASDDKTIRLWDVASDTSTAVLKGHTSSVWSVAFSPDGRTLASSSKDGTIRLWDVATGTSVAVLHGHDEGVTSVMFSPDGRTLASGSWDNSVGLWDVASRTRTATLEGHTNNVIGVAFSPDGRSVASAAQDGKILLWDVASHRGMGVFTGHAKGVEAVAFSPDGKTLASGGDDNDVMLWDVATRTRIAVLKGHKGDIDSVAFSPDGKTLASGAEDKSMRLWDLTR
jgi:WD40 repeat protein/tRNA A-37 threonylcarbamoyl transferase component Bud32